MLAAPWVSMTVSFTRFASAAAVTVIVWGVSQFDVVKVRAVGLGVTSVPECPATVTVTPAVGWVSRTTV